MSKVNISEIPEIFTASTYAEIRRKLLDWLSNQDEFKDYDFAGSRLSILVDLLAYNTLYIQQFANSALYESFIRTANLRSSIVQHAQDMGYFPTGKKASKTTVRFTASHANSGIRAITIPKGTRFVGTVDKVDPYEYCTWEDVVIELGKNGLYIALLDLYQGSLVRTGMRYEKDGKIILKDKTIDRDLIRVYVDGAEWTDWTNKPMVSITGTATVFYMRETIDGELEIFFGEGEGSPEVDEDKRLMMNNYVGGLKPAVGSEVVIEYLSTDGEVANGSLNMTYVDTIDKIIVEKVEENPYSDMNFVGSIGGGEPESADRIRELAPVLREAQRRCVTARDYETFVSYKFGNIVQAIQCFTDNEKPGYAFIAIKPTSGLTLTTVQKEDIHTFLKEYNIATISPVVLDPNYLYVRQNVKVTYNLNELSETEEWLQGQVLNSIDQYYTKEVEIFNKSFHVSKMLKYVDNSDVSILGSSATIGLTRELLNFYASPMSGIKFLNTIVDGSVKSSVFSYVESPELHYDIHYVGTKANTENKHRGDILVGPFADNKVFTDGQGKVIQEYQGTDFEKEVFEDRSKYYKVGVVDYVTDEIDFDLGVLQININDVRGAYIELSATPTNDNIFTKDGSLIVFEHELRPQYTTITMEAISQ
ncbi:baseplate wedge subunit [Citrobacter phage Ci1]|nr:baseplate wedge subunit [Citrobacter phage Ci1]